MTEHSDRSETGIISGNLIPGFLKNLAASKYTPWFIAALYVIAMGILGLIFHRIGDYKVETDFYWTYIPSAHGILEGNLVVDDFKGPGYPMILAVSKLFIGEFFKTGIVISVFSTGLFLLMTYLLLKKVFSPEIAFLVTCALMCNTAFVRYSYTASTDMPFAALVMMIIYLSLRNDNLKIADMALCGLVSGYTYLMRYNAVSIIIAFVFVLLVFNVKSTPLVQRFKGLFVYCIAASLFILPWLIYSHAVTGDLFYQKNHLNIAYEIYGKGIMNWDQWWAQEATQYRSLVSVLFHDPMLMLQRLFINLGEHFVNDLVWLIGIWWGICAVCGLYAVTHQHLTRRQWAIFIIGGTYFLFLVPFFTVIALHSLLCPYTSSSRYCYSCGLSANWKISDGL